VKKRFLKSFKINSNESAAKILIETNKMMNSLRIYDTSYQIGTNLCARNNGNCQHLCLFNGRKPICRCSYSNLTLSGKCQRKLIVFI
jgi:low-density lipoprotein receptor-related protein 1 (alpha-2-macroglobulin receptor)